MSTKILSNSSQDIAFHSRAIAIAIFNETSLNGATSVLAAEFIQQLHYWTEKGSGILHEGARWIYNSYREWMKTQFPTLSSYYFRSIKNALEQIDLIKVRKLRAKEWKQSYCYTLSYKALFELLGWEKWLEPLKTPIVKNVNHRSSTALTIDDQQCLPSYTKNNNIEDTQRENIEQKEILLPGEPTKIDKNILVGSPGINLNTSLDNSDLDKDINNESVDQKINKIENKIALALLKGSRANVKSYVARADRAETCQEKEEIKASFSDPPISSNSIIRQKTDMGQHKPEGDQNFGNKRQQIVEVKEKGKRFSAVGLSGFRDLQDLQQCQKELTIYFGKLMDAKKAATEASWIIKAAKAGERSLFVQDYFDNQPIGTHCQKDWEIEPGVIAPVFLCYLRHELRQDGDTKAKALSRVKWELAQPDVAEEHWTDCLEFIAQEKPRLLDALKRGVNPISLNIPDWFIRAYKPKTTVQEALPVAEALGEIATKYIQQVEEHQQELLPRETDIPVLPGDSPILGMLNNLGVLVKTLPEVTDEEKREKVDALLDKEGVSEEKEGVSEELENSEAYKPFVAEKIEVADPSALQKALAKSKFLKHRKKA